MRDEALTRSAGGNQDYSDRAIKHLPTAEETVEILLAWEDALIRRHLAIRHPEELTDEGYRAALDVVTRRKYGPRPLPWDERDPGEAEPEDVEETLLSHLDFLDGDDAAKAWWWERCRWLRRCHPVRGRAVRRALDRRRGK